MKENIPIITANFDPFKLVISNTNDYWSATLDEINTNTYNYEKLNQTSLSLDIGLEHYSLLVSYDGTLILPRINKFSDPYHTLSVFNDVLTCLLLGGEYCEAVLPEDIGYGLIDSNNRSMIIAGATGKISSFHKLIKSSLVGKVDAIRLHNPAFITVEEFKKSYEIGKKVLQKLNNLKLEQLLFGVTFYNRQQLPESLIHFWISIERLVEFFWNRDFESKTKELMKNLNKKKDYWTISNKIDVLYSYDFFSEDLYDNLTNIRRARNDFAHAGIIPSREIVRLSAKCFFEFLSLSYTDFKNDKFFDEIVKKLIGNSHSDLFIFNVDQETYEINDWDNLIP